MVRFIFFIMLTLVTTKGLFATEIVVNFSNMTIEEARRKAGAEGKLLFVDFHAKWCTPCKWMEQTTFKDEDIIHTLNSDFVSVKIDIDEIQGYETKKAFGIKYLPTMLIFNSQGQLIERIEETLSPRLLKEKLNNHNEPQNKQITIHGINSAPSKMTLPPSQNGSQMSNSRSENRRYFEQSENQTTYRVQVGVFSTYEAAQNQIKSLQANFLEPITVINEIRNGETLFKVRMGQFSNYKDAESFRFLLANEYQIKSIVQ